MTATTAPNAHSVDYLKSTIAQISAISTTAADFLVMILNEEYANRTFEFSAMRKMVEQVQADLRYTDKALEIAQQGPSKGDARAAGYLLAIPEHARRAVVAEAFAQANACGMRYADAVYARADRWQQTLADYNQARGLVSA